MKRCKPGSRKWYCRAGGWVSRNRHKIVNFGVGFAATTGTAACIMSVVCGAGLFVVGAAALFAGGLTAHYAVSSRAERRRGMGRHFKSTLWAESKGIVCGATFGRGCALGYAFGARKTRKGKFLFSGIPRRHYARRLGRMLRDLW
jgi:hypothetical protein